MQVIYHDTTSTVGTAAATAQKKLARYREHISAVIEDFNDSEPEFSLAQFQDEELLATADRLATTYKKATHVILVGIGGSSLGVEAIDAVLTPAEGGKKLHVIDAISPYRIATLLAELKSVKSAKKVVVCIISKSGGTTEALANAAVLLSELEKKYGKKIHKQSIYIGDSGNPLLATGKESGSEVVEMPAAVGGRYSVFTAVGILPLALLGHDVGEILCGVEDASHESFDDMTAESAAKLFVYLKTGTHTLNFFGFDVRLEKLGFWVRQLVAESIGKETTRDGKPNKLGAVPVVTTPVELHSIGQLYFSGFPGVYTEFVSFEDEVYDYTVSAKNKFAKKLAGKTLGDIDAAIYGGVVSAYQERKLPYRSVEFDETLPYSLGLYMAMRMRETMYIAELMNVDAFDQPNVELYKEKTRELLDV